MTFIKLEVGFLWQRSCCRNAISSGRCFVEVKYVTYRRLTLAELADWSCVEICLLSDVDGHVKVECQDHFGG